MNMRSSVPWGPWLPWALRGRTLWSELALARKADAIWVRWCGTLDPENNTLINGECDSLNEKWVRR